MVDRHIANEVQASQTLCKRFAARKTIIFRNGLLVGVGHACKELRQQTEIPNLHRHPDRQLAVLHFVVLNKGLLARAPQQGLVLVQPDLVPCAALSRSMADLFLGEMAMQTGRIFMRHGVAGSQSVRNIDPNRQLYALQSIECQQLELLVKNVQTDPIAELAAGQEIIAADRRPWVSDVPPSMQRMGYQ